MSRPNAVQSAISCYVPSQPVHSTGTLLQRGLADEADTREIYALLRRPFSIGTRFLNTYDLLISADWHFITPAPRRRKTRAT